MNFASALCPQHDFRTGCNQEKAPGAVVMAGRNLGPLYRIVAIDGNNAWVRELDRGVDAIAPLDRLRVV
jgi:hypothetical protein